MKRQVINIPNDNKIALNLKRIDGAENQIFYLKKEIGHGSSAVVYEAEYIISGIAHNCILKELYPADCGLVRDEKDGISLCFSEENDGVNIPKYKKIYKVIYDRYIEAYKIQNQFRYSDSNSLEDKMLLSAGISAPLGIYENNFGILYTIYAADNGLSYDMFNTINNPMKETFWDILSVIIQVGNMISFFHKAGYIVLDIKESNILISGSTNNRIAILFDFNSFIKKELLKKYRVNDGIAISFSSEENGKDLCIPSELRNYRRYFADNDVDGIEECVNSLLGEYGERTDIYLLAMILYRRLFGYDNQNKINNRFNEYNTIKSQYISIPFLKDKLGEIFKRALAYSSYDRYEEMDDFLSDLRVLQSFSVLEDSYDRDNFVREGLLWTLTDINKNLVYAASRIHWEELGGENGKFSQLIKFSNRFDNIVYMVDNEENQISPEEAIHHSRYCLFIGEGGMGKSTSVFDYWTNQLIKKYDESKICLYIDLSKFSLGRNNNRNPSENFGEVNTEYPMDLLTYIEMDISGKCNINEFVARPMDISSDKYYSDRINALNALFSMNTQEPEYVLILDGYNEILDNITRRKLKSNLQNAIKFWKNVSVVLTSRSMIANEKTEGFEAEDDVFDKFDTYRFLGVPSREIKNQIIKNKKFSNKEISIIETKKIWEVIKIPMFLNMYLGINEDGLKPINTCGELLDCYIRHRELIIARRISNDIHLDYRSFVVLLSLPFIANNMDQNRTFFINSFSEIKKQIKDSFKLYLNDNQVYDNFTESLSEEFRLNFEDIDYSDFEKKLKNLLINETGYCYEIKDGSVGFVHQYFRDYFAAKHIQNILTAAQSQGEAGASKKVQLQFIKDNGLDYIWSDDVCILLGEIIGDYKNDPEYTETK